MNVNVGHRACEGRFEDGGNESKLDDDWMEGVMRVCLNLKLIRSEWSPVRRR